MNPETIQSAIEEQKKQFSDATLLPNTLQRNLVLAGHRTEIARLEKCLTASTKVKRAPKATGQLS